MADKIIENNQVSITGKIVTGFTFSHQVYGEGFYTMDLLVKRLSDSEDRIPVMVSERLVDVTQDYVGQYVEIHGQFRSYNRHEEKHNRLVLSAFARELKFLEEEDSLAPVNQIFLDGYICKPPVYRKTPLGREIADLLLAVNRPYGKSDYIPCICWGRNARYASAFEVGGHVPVSYTHLMSFASLSTVIAVFENIISYSMDRKGWSRGKAVIVLSLIHI